MKRPAYHYLEYGEIIERFLAATAPLCGPSCFPVDINFSADNMTEPPIISCKVYVPGREGKWEIIFDDGVDQNTPMEQFLSSLARLRKVVHTCLKAIQEGTTYEEQLDKPVADENEDLPF